MSRRHVIGGALAATALTLSVTAGAASATSSPGAPPPDAFTHWRQTLTTEVLGPFGIDVRHGDVLVADGFTGVVSHLVGRHAVPVVTDAPGAAGVARSADGTRMAYTTTAGMGKATSLVITQAGKADVVADLSGFEARANPDAGVSYGLLPTASDCAKQFMRKVSGGPATYTGLVDSHPYAVAPLDDGSWAVAEAAGNDVLRVSPTGAISVLALLPAQPLVFTAAMAASLGGPDCLVGETYRFEPVPTDVEVAPGGRLFVTTLPGGPEGPELGARGSVYRLNPSSGGAVRVATGFLGATNLAIGSGDAGNTLFVTELFAGRISKVKAGRTTTFATLPNVLSVEVDDGSVYAGTLAQLDDLGNVTAPGSVVRLSR
ncbi:MAG: ScyD/ScyE family protein [Actinomycetota bacterium]|nr:ScyD/ScyE family protein [Actinomycetota bacterium]